MSKNTIYVGNMHNTSSSGEILHLRIYNFWSNETEQQFILVM